MTAPSRAHSLLLLLSLLSWPPVSAADAATSRTELRDPEIRMRVVGHLAQRSRTDRLLARSIARRQNWAPQGRRNHTVWHVMAVRDDFVLAFKTLNVNAAVSVGAGEILRVEPYELYGSTRRIGVWDGGTALASHQEFGGRVVLKDQIDTINHATHVVGTIAAHGVNAAATGMAPRVLADSYKYDDDFAEMAGVAMSHPDERDKLQISNHSYGTISGWDYNSEMPRWYGQWGSRESDVFGQYNPEAREVDGICFDAPFYLPFWPTGNDRNERTPAPGEKFEYYQSRSGWVEKTFDPATDPYKDGWDDGGYDTILPTSSAKNVMTVGAVGDAVYRGIRDPSRARMTSFSGWGPVDDGRIKPDLVANGTALFSPTADSGSSYASYSGSSMATACASGATLLLTEYWDRLRPGRMMRSSTIKALLIHTADDLGTAGPDYTFGWGLMNVKAAIEHICRHHAESAANGIVESMLRDRIPLETYQLVSDGRTPIRATLAWTDPPARAVGGLDNTSSRLVNDLDLRIIDPCGVVHYPFVLDPEEPSAEAYAADNTRDNVEQIEIPLPPCGGVYQVEVTYKRALQNWQWYALILSGRPAQCSSRADFDGNGAVDADDLAILLDAWLGDTANLDLAPPKGDGIIDFSDFAAFMRAWQQQP